MADDRIHRLFDLVDDAPSPAFESALRERILAELAALGSARAAGPTDPTDTRRPSVPDQTEELIVITDRPRTTAAERRSRRVVIALVAAAAAAALVVTGVLIARDDDPTPSVTTAAVTTVAPSTTTPATTAPPTTAPPTTAPPTTAPPTTATTPRSTLPVDVVPGTYVAGRLPLPIGFSVAQPWRRVLELRDLLTLGRGEDGFGGEIVITVDRFDEAALAQVLGGVCATQLDLGETSTTTLLGAPAERVEGTASSDCLFSALGGQGFVLPGGHRFVLVSSVVDGHVVVVLADAPAGEWSTFLPEVDAVLASMSMTG